MRVFCLLISGCLIIGLNASAQLTNLDLSTALRMADTANLTLRNARLDVTMNEKQEKAYLSAKLPHLSFNADYKYNAIIPGQVVPAQFFGGPAGTYAKVQFGVPFTLSNTLQATQVLYNPQVNYGLKALSINSKIVELQQSLSEQDTRYQVASTWFSLQAVNRQIEYLDTNIVNVEKTLSIMNAMVREQLILQTESDKVQINRLNLINSRETLLSTREQLTDLLRILIGVDQNVSITLSGDEMVQQSLLVDEGTVNRPEQQLIAAQQELNVAERKGTNMAYLPSLSAYAAYNYTYNMKPEANFRTGIDAAFMGIKLDWTLFDGMEKYNKQKVNAITRDKLANQAELVKEQLDMQTATAKRQVEISRTSLGIAQEQLKLAQRVYTQSERQLEEGTIGTNDFLLSDNALQQAQSNVVGAYVQLRKSELDYLKSIGNIK